jgi:hypothetical protein
MSKYSLVSVNNLIAKSVREGLTGVGVSEADTVEMIGEALEFIGAFGQYEEESIILKVEDHKVSLPSDLVEIIQIAYTKETVDNNLCLTDEGETLDESCPTCPEAETPSCWNSHNEYYIPEQRYYDVIASYNTVSNYNNNYYNNFQPLKLDKSNFRSAKSSHCMDSINLYCDSEDSYSIHKGYINTSFQTGTLALAYLQQPTDENGYPMVIDEISFRTAIVAYLKMRLADIKYFTDPTPSHERLLQRYTNDWQWYCKQAKNTQLMPSNLDEREQLYRSNMRLVKKRNAYGSFFANSNNLDNLNFNNYG